VSSWSVGDYLTHRFNPELGVGRVTAVEGRTVVVEFRDADATLRLAANNDALKPVTTPDTVAVEESLLDQLAAGNVDDARDFLIRVDALHLLAVREAQGLGSFLGGRVRLFPHQLYVAERAAAQSPVRWLLADEVGLGKTIEACLILNHLVHTGDVTRCVVVAPEALTVQWLGELWRKYHQVFTLLDQPRLADVARDFGSDFNPFDVHRRVVIALETLMAQPQLTDQAVAAGIDLLVVDEAQRLRRPPGHPGEPAWRAVAPIAALGRHVLLLSATPLEDDAHGFMRLLQLLRPDEFPEDVSFDARLTSGIPLPPCTSATRRTDIGGLPPRVGVPVDLMDADKWRERDEIEAAMRSMPAPHAVARRQKVDRIRRAISSGAALAAVLGPDERDLRARAQRLDTQDPRVEWLAVQAQRWRAAGDKTLVFVADRETLEMLRTALSHRAQLATGMFHEELSTVRRDTEVARFREADGPSLLVSTEAGGEGRNFEFCRRLVLFDLPWKPSVVEQRIGRLDRIGRRIPVEVVYFRPPSGIAADVVRLFERLGLFQEPLAGVEPQLASIEGAIDEIALDPHASLSDARIDDLLSAAFAARTRIQDAAYEQLHRDPYRAAMADSILARVPKDLDALIEDVVVRACTRLGFRADHLRGRSIFAIEFGNEATIDSLPGVAGGSTFVGTFDREEAVATETIDFFASGHALVEGILGHYQDGAQGRVADLEFITSDDRGDGIVVLYKDGGRLEIVALDQDGRERPEWATLLQRGRLRARRMSDATARERDWGALVRRLSPLLPATRRPECVATIALRPTKP
jgi:ATP-dependent helicase HepA